MWVRVKEACPYHVRYNSVQLQHTAQQAGAALGVPAAGRGRLYCLEGDAEKRQNGGLETNKKE